MEWSTLEQGYFFFLGHTELCVWVFNISVSLIENCLKCLKSQNLCAV